MERNVERHTRHTLAELMTQETYQPEEVAKLLDINVDVIRHAAFSGELPAQLIGHSVVNIRREDLLNWYDSR